jgi:hypothetical protein
MTIHIVKEGEYLSLIARQYGFRSAKPIWNHPKNADLKTRRSDPNLLHPADEVFIPPKMDSTRSVPCATGAEHYFRLRRGKLLRIYIRDAKGQLLKNESCTLNIGDSKIKKCTTDEGLFETSIADDARVATLIVRNCVWTLRIGGLNPISDTTDQGVSGAQERLANLGYSVGSIDGLMGPRTRAAIRAFQRDCRLKRTGELDPQTLKKLQSRHCS